MNGIKILGTGRGVPSKLVTNEDMAKIVDTNDEWITSRTGITHRHHLAEGETITDMTVLSARRALENAGITADQIGACIVATLTPDTLVPSAACCVQRDLGLPHDTVCFDLNAACTVYTIADLHLPLGIDKPMDIFGKAWENYVARLADNWQSVVKENDVVVLPGDFSWATYLEQSVKDFEYLHKLNGKKILLKGNHDYWWTTMNKLREFTAEPLL